MVLFHQGNGISVSCYYIDPNLNAYAISSAQVLLELRCNLVFSISTSWEWFCLLKTCRCTQILRQILISSSRGEGIRNNITNSFVKWLCCCFFYFHGCSLAQAFASLSELAEHLVSAVDIVFPVIHGRFGEDGGIQVCCFVLGVLINFIFYIRTLDNILING